MPVVEKTAGGRVYVRDVGEFVLGDRADVDADTAAHLCEGRGDFERVGTGGPEGSGGDDRPDTTAVATADDDSDTLDINAFLDRTPVGDVADDIRAGEADGQLDAVAEAADRVTVRDAVGERRAELEA